MKKMTILLFVLLAVNIGAVFYFIQLSDKPTVYLTPKEQQYLQSISPIKMAVDPDWEPFEKLDKEGRYTGIAADYIDIIEQRLHIQFELVPTINWAQSLQYSQEGKVQILPLLNKTAEREQWLTFTEPLLIDDNVIIGRYDTPYIENLASVKNKTIALPEGTSVEERLRNDYPNLQILIVQSEKEAFEKVSKGEVDYTIRSLLISSYNIRHQGWFDLKVVGKLQGYTNYLAVGIVKEEGQLKNILNKAILSITEEERVDILNKHIPLRVQTETANKKIIVSLIVVLIATVLLIMLNYVQSIRAKRLQKKHEEIQQITTRYEVLSELAGTYFWQTKTDGTISYISREIQQVLGYRAEELMEQHYKQNVSAGFYPLNFELLIQQLKEGRTVKDFETTQMKKDGTMIWIKVNAMPIFDEHRHIIGYRGSCTDIQLTKQLQLALLEAKDEIELAYYQAQIAPHFLYNALSAIAMYCLTEPKKASDLIVDLSFFLRKSFDFKNLNRLVTLKQELELIEAYTNIEKVRFEDRLQLQFEIKESAKKLRLPPLILQPLVENAINHGIMKRIEGGTIIIRAKQYENYVRFEVCDNGVGMPNEQIEQLNCLKEHLERNADFIQFERHGVGLKNIHARLIKLYSSKLIVSLNEFGGTTVAFEIPIHVTGSDTR